jgi:hypothetical protein
MSYGVELTTVDTSRMLLAKPSWALAWMVESGRRGGCSSCPPDGRLSVVEERRAAATREEDAVWEDKTRIRRQAPSAAGLRRLFLEEFGIVIFVPG